MKRTISLVLAIMLALTMIPAMAAAQASIVKETLYTGMGEYYIKIKNWTYEEEIISVTSSDPSVLEVTENRDRGVEVKGVGQAKIRIKYKLNGNTRTISAKFTVKEYPKPIKSLTINGEKITLRKDTLVQYRYDLPNLDRSYSIKINMKPASGWSIKQIEAYYYNVGKTSKHYNLKVKNNKSFKLKKRCEAAVTYTLKNKKGEKFTYLIRIMCGGE